MGLRHFLIFAGLATIVGCGAETEAQAPAETDTPSPLAEEPGLTRAPGEIIAAAAPADWRMIEPEETLYIELERGRVVIALATQLAPAHVAQVKTLTRDGFYDGLSFYRVIDGFVAQGGDPFEERALKNAAPSMTAEFDEPLRDDIRFSAIADKDGYAAQVGFVDTLPAGVDAAGETVWHLHCAGAFAFGRNDDRDSASTEFYITLQPQRYLDRNLSVFGRVIDGMEHVQALRRVAPPESKDDDLGETIISMRIAADVPEAERTDFEILDSGRPIFAEYVASRRNRPEAFFHFRHDYIDVCQLPIPVRPASDSN